MALTTVSGLTLYNNCDSITGWTGPDGVDTTEQIEGAGCLAADIDIETGVWLGPTITAIDMSTTKYAIYPWVLNMTARYLDLLANGGLAVVLGDGTNYSWWNVGGSDSYPGGYEVLVANTDAAPDGNSGTPANLSAITRIGFQFKGVAKSKLADNSFLDYVRYASGVALRIYGTNTTADDGWSEVLSGDATLIAGIIKAQAGSYVLKGPIEIGDSVGTNSTTFTEDGSVIVFDGGPVGDNHHGITGVGNGTGTTSVTLKNQTILSAGGRFSFDQTHANLTSFSITGGSLTHAGAVKFKSGQTVKSVVFTDSLTTSIANAPDGCTFKTGGLITLETGGTLVDCLVDSSTGAVSVITDDLADVGASRFISDGSNHAVELSALGTGSMTWSAVTSGYDAGTTGSPVTPTNTGNEDIYVNFTSASDLTINVQAGATTPSIRVGAGFTGNVNVVAGAVTLTVTAKDIETDLPIEGASVYAKLIAGDGGAVVMNGETDATGVYTTQYSGTKPVTLDSTVSAVRAGSFAKPYVEFTLGGQITSSGYTATALMSED